MADSLLALRVRSAAPLRRSLGTGGLRRWLPATLVAACLPVLLLAAPARAGLTLFGSRASEFPACDARVNTYLERSLSDYRESQQQLHREVAVQTSPGDPVKWIMNWIDERVLSGKVESRRQSLVTWAEQSYRCQPSWK